jgi:hypothetical protein
MHFKFQWYVHLDASNEALGIEPEPFNYYIWCGENITT